MFIAYKNFVVYQEMTRIDHNFVSNGIAQLAAPSLDRGSQRAPSIALPCAELGAATTFHFLGKS